MTLPTEIMTVTFPKFFSMLTLSVYWLTTPYPSKKRYWEEKEFLQRVMLKILIWKRRHAEAVTDLQRKSIQENIDFHTKVMHDAVWDYFGPWVILKL